MFEQFLKVAADKLAQENLEREIHSLLVQLPKEELFKLAGGVKLASSENWLDQFKGSPFFEQAVALEQELLQLDMEDIQQRQQNQARWSQQDAIRIKRRLLELQAATAGQQAQQAEEQEAAMAAQAPPQEAAAPSPTVKKTTVEEKTEAPKESAPPSQEEPKVASEGGEKTIAFRAGEAVGRHSDVVPGVVGGVLGAAAGYGTGLGTAEGLGMSPRLQTALSAGGLLGGGALGYMTGRGVGRFSQGTVSGMAHAQGGKSAPAEAEKQAMAYINALENVARDMARRDMEKSANMGMLANAGKAVMNFAKANPGAAIGAGVGAIGGASQGEGISGKLMGAVGGGALGAGVGHAGGKLVTNLRHAKNTGGTAMEAIGATGRQLKFQGQQAVQSASQRLSGARPDIGGTVNPAASAVQAAPAGPSPLSQMYQRGIAQSAPTAAHGRAQMVPPAPTVNG